MSEPTPEVWIGLAEVWQHAGAGVLPDSNEAFVNVLAMAKDGPDFIAKVRNALHELGFELQDLDDGESLRSRMQSYTVDDDLLRLAQEVSATGQARFGAFHTWVEDDEAG